MNEKNENSTIQTELDIRILWNTLKNHFLPIILIAVFVAAVSGIYTVFFVDKQYTSTAMLYLENKKTTSSSLSTSDITAAQKLVDTCKIVSGSNTTLNAVSSALFDKYLMKTSKLSLSKSIVLSAVNGTSIINLSVITDDPQRSEQICNTAAQVVSDEFTRIVNSASIKIVHFGDVADTPSSPNVTKNLSLALIMGLLFAYAGFVVFEVLNVTVKSDDDLSMRYNAPVFAEIPDYLGKGVNNKHKSYKYSNNDNKNDNNESTALSVVEAYNTMRTNLQFAAGPYDNKIFVFTSSNASEGKSTVASNSAASFGKAGFKVLLIDSDLRRPTIHSVFKADNKKGYSLYLCGLIGKEDAITANVSEKLDIITSGPIPPNPSELLSSPRVKSLLDWASKEYDYIFIDCPPVNIISDCLLYTNITSGIIFVTREGYTVHPEIAEAVAKIKMADGKLLGIVKSFCNFGGKSNNYKYKYKYKYRYNYKSTPENKKEL